MVNLPISSPDSIPFNICAPLVNKKLCFIANNLVVTPGHVRDCGWGGTSGPLDASCSLSYLEKDLVDDTITLSLDYWVGVETNFDAIWIGVDGGGCERIPIFNPPSPTWSIDDIVEYLSDKKDQIANAVSNIHWEAPDTGSPLELLVLIILIIIAIIVSALGGPITS